MAERSCADDSPPTGTHHAQAPALETRRRRALATLLALPALLAAQARAAGVWPERPVRFVVPLPPGGSYDYLARLLGDQFRVAFNQSFVVENRVGADGRLGIDHLVRQPADGQTIGIISSTHVVHPSLVRQMPYDVLRDLAPIGLIAKAPFVLVVHPGVPVDSVSAYMALARAQPGKLTFGSSGVGSPFHLAGELMKRMAGIDMLHVPYKGSSPVISALLGGEIMSAFAALGPVLGHIQAGRLRALGIVDSQRTRVLPAIPTIAEAGPLPGYGLDSWLGLVAPAGTPAEIIDRIGSELNRTVQNPEFAEQRLIRQGYDPFVSTPAAMRETMVSDLARYARLIRDANIPAE